MTHIELRQLFVMLEEQGFTVHQTRGGYLVKSPDGKGSTAFHRNSKGTRGIVANLVRIGFQVKGSDKDDSKESPGS